MFIDRDVNKEEIKEDKKQTDNAECSNSVENDGEYLNVYEEETLNNLRDGILKTYQPPLEHLKKQLEELTYVWGKWSKMGCKLMFLG